jgi:amidase
MEHSSRLQWESNFRACAIVISTEFVHSYSMTIETNLCELTATALAKALARREVSAADVIEAHLACIRARDTGLAAFVTVDADGARRQAAACDAARTPIGPLHGLPIAVKDLTNSAGLRTTYGSLLFGNHVPAQDELVVARLRQAGAVIIGKTNTPEFGFGAVCTNRLCGPTRNPFDVALTSGGSSGGSAVAVATGMAPIAHGTDFGGSVRTPASFCDVVSIRPTPGRIPVPARALGWDMLASHGLLARSVDDLELGLSACIGPDIRDPLSIGAGPHVELATGRPRLAVTPDFGVAPVAKEVRTRFAVACKALSQIAEVEEVSPDCGGGIETFRTLRAAHIADSYGALLRERRAELTPTVIWNIEAGAHITAQDYLAAERRRTVIYRSFRDLLARRDFLIVPAASVLPWNNDDGDVMRIDDVSLETPIDYLAVTFIVSLVGFPVLTLPTPRRQDEKPFGVQIIAAPGQESRLFAFGRSVEEQLGFCHRRPPI